MNVEEIFSEAAKILTPAGRAEYLDKACAGDLALRQRVESLLAAHEAAASFLESAAAEFPTKAPATFAPPQPIIERPGTVIGRYKLLQQIGEGGMGVVYMAEQEKPVRRRVALKIIKPGMDSTQVIARFEAERQALAMMDHPNIARVLDAGATRTVSRLSNGLESLRQLPNLARISYSILHSGEVDMTADQFWGIAALQSEEHWIAALDKANVVYKRRRLADGSWGLILDDQPIADLSLLKGANITNLSIMRTPVADLSPLRGMKLTALRLSGTQVTDLTPLKGMPITSLNISGTQVSDLTSLAGMPLRTLSMTGCDQIIDLSPLADTSGTLESLILPPNAKDIELLRNFPNLKRLGYQYDSGIKGPIQATQEFWAAFDKAHRTATTQP